jgi:hypothetical protein
MLDSVNMTTIVTTPEGLAEMGEAPVQQMLKRGTQTLRSVLCKAGARGMQPLQTTTNEIGFLIAAARLAIEEVEIKAEGAEQELQAARVRGLERMAALRKAAEPVLESGEVGKLLGVSRETIRKKVDRHQLLALPKGGDRVFPAFQFADGDVLPGVAEVLAALDTASVFVALSFFLSQHPAFDGRTAIQLLQAGEKDAVVAEAKGFLNHGS